MFAATPPIEAMKMLLPAAITEGVGYDRGREDKGMTFEFIDINKAYLQAETKREVYVALPDEDKETGMCAKLIKSMYGTRDAAPNWESM